jgi:hypothetical protein
MHGGNMTDHPFDECVVAAVQLCEEGSDVYQKYTCAHCGSRLSMEEPNKFWDYGSCDKCEPEKVTDIRKHGMNYMIVMGSDSGAPRMLTLVQVHKSKLSKCDVR